MSFGGATREDRYRDRAEAGRALARLLRAYANRSDVVVVGIPRGGLPVAHAVAAELGAPLALVLVRKLRYGGQTELAMGAIASGGVRVLNEAVCAVTSKRALDRAIAREVRALEALEALYGRPSDAPSLAGRAVVLVDDGVATGATMRAAIAVLRARGPREIVAAFPIAPFAVARALRDEADRVVASRIPPCFVAVGLAYDDFSAPSDAELLALLGSNGALALPGPVGQQSAAHAGEAATRRDTR